MFGSVAAAPAWVLQNLIYVSPAFPLILGLLAVIRLKLGGIDVRAMIGWPGQTQARDLILGLIVGAAAVAVAVASLRIAAPYLQVPAVHQLPAAVHIYFMTIGAVIPGVCEELYFRGMMMRAGHALSKAAMLIVTSAAFSLWHIGTPAYLPHTLILGLILGFLTLYSGRLAPAIIAHICANAGMGLLLLSGFNLAGR
jgi:membrane protease YdiL (CAAX protease family)